jgi:hypothetical protein
MALARSLGGALFSILAAVGCSITVTPKDKGDAGTEAGAIVCCRTEPDAGPEGCLCEPASSDTIVVNGASCSAAATVNGEAVDFTGYVVSTCP